MQEPLNGFAAGDSASGASPHDPQRSEPLLHAVLESTDDGILVVDVHSRRVVTWNRRFQEMWQLSDPLLRGGDADEVERWMGTQVADLPRFAARLAQRYAAPEEDSVDTLELRGGLVYERWSRPYRLAGRVVGRVWSFRDLTARRSAEEALRVSEASYRTIFDLAGDAIYVHDAETGAVLDVNERAREFHGLTAEEFARQGVQAVSTGEAPFTAEAALRHIHLAAAGEPQIFPWRAQHRSGRMFWIEVSLRAVEIGGRKRVLATARDITERRAAEAVLQRSQEELEQAVAERTAEVARAHAVVRENEERYRALAEADPDGIVVLDDNSGILSVNPAMQRIFGYEPEELIGQPLTVLMPERMREAHRKGIARYLATGRKGMPWEGVQVPGQRKDGSEVPLEINFGEYTVEGRHCFAGFIRDITERKRAEEELRFQGALLAAQNDAAIDGILVAHEGKVLSMNRRYADIFNVPEELRPLDRCQEMLRWAVARTADPAGYQASIERLRGDPEATHRDEVLLADGRVLDRYSSPLKGPQGQLYGRIWVIRDISERKEIEAALQQAKEEAERANLAKSEFLSRMSHELRTPLNSILGFGQVLTRRELQPEQRRGVEHIMKAGRHLLSLIDEVLDISRIEANRQQLSVEPVHAGELLEEALALIRPMAQQRPVGLIEHAPAATDVHVRADRQRLMQVVLNLLSNAVKYNRPGGTVEVLALRAQAEDGGARLRFGVRDTGPGIPAERIGELFVPFSRLGAAEDGVEGTGLGLALSKRLVEAMQGELEVESAEGQGSTFWVELPVVPHPMERLESYRPGGGAAASPARDADREPRKVLYVEDNLANLNLVESIFEDRPEIQILPALQGRMGLELAREHHPDLVLLDLHLPDISGEEVLRELRTDTRTADIPVLVISADATPRQITRLRLAGARGYLTKPLDLDQFLSEVDSALGPTPGAPEP